MKATAFLMASLSCCLSIAQENTPMTEHEVECTAELQNSCYMLTLITEFGVKEKLKTTVEKTSSRVSLRTRSSLTSATPKAPGTGVFAAPVRGNGECMSIRSDPKSSTDTADNRGDAVTLQLEVGDQVYIRLRANAHVGPSHTSFSSFLLSQV
uniref:C1q domain-containing protein n=1 Tax=Oncorhynchus tshawytscha TaxID=74940 RepID=A0A8C8JCH2_ONCTS